MQENELHFEPLVGVLFFASTKSDVVLGELYTGYPNYEAGPRNRRWVISNPCGCFLIRNKVASREFT
jgi:hypothetical protein